MKDFDGEKLRKLQECCMRHGICIVPEKDGFFSIYTSPGHKYMCQGISPFSDTIAVNIVILDENEIN